MTSARGSHCVGVLECEVDAIRRCGAKARVINERAARDELALLAAVAAQAMSR